MLEHVLVPLDGSELSEAAIEHAMTLLGGEGEMTFLRVVDTKTGLEHYKEPQREQIRQEMIESADGYLKRLGEPLLKRGVRTKTEVRTGKPADVIVDVARELKVNAIAMSTHGRTGISRWRFGSVAQKVLTAAPCPVYIIPSKNMDGKQASGE